MQGDTLNAFERISKILLDEFTFGIPDYEAMVLTIESDDTGIVRFGGQEQSLWEYTGHFKSSDFFATRKLPE